MWEDLNIRDKSDLIRLYISNGIVDLGMMKEHYNSFQDGGPVDNKSDWAKAHETELALHQLGWDNPDNRLHSDYAAKDNEGYYAGYNLKPVTVRPSVQQQLIDIGKNNPKAKGVVEYVDPDIVAENNTMGLKLWGTLAGVKAPINYKKTLDYLSTPFSSTIKALPINKNNFLKRAGWVADTSLNVLGSLDALNNVLNENGVTNTLNAFSKGDYKEGVLSGIGDLWNISSIYGLKKYIPNKLPNGNIFRNRKLNKEWIRNKGYEPLVNDIRTAFIHQYEDFPELFRPARTALVKTNHNQGLNGVKMQFDDHNYILNGSKWYTPWKWNLRNIFYGSAENIPSYTLDPDVIRYHPLTFFTSPKKFQGMTAHEINHSFARVYSKKGSLSEFSNAKKGYPFIANDDNVVDLSAFNKRAFKHNGSPEELQSDMRAWKHILNNDQRIPYNYMPTNQREKYIDLAEKEYFIDTDVLKKLLTDLSSYGYFQNGGSLGKVTTYGQWQYPGKVTTIPSNNITMKGVDYPVIGVSNTGDTKMMFPNLDYTFNGNYVTEYPIN